MYVHVVLHNVAFGLFAVLTWCAIFCMIVRAGAKGGELKGYNARSLKKGTPLRRGAMICHDVPQ